MTQRIAELAAIVAGTGDYDAFFSPPFRQSVPRQQFVAVFTQLVGALGRPLRIERTAPTAPRNATVTMAFERGTATLEIAIDAAAPNQVTGLLVKGTAITDDSFAKLDADFRKLPGISGYGVCALDGPMPRAITTYNDAAPAPLGSGFKLWILAEAARQVKAGMRKWSDVVPLGTPSLPSGITQSWPTGSPLTLHTLATLMISISDNSAADTLLRLLGRDAVDAMARAHGATSASLPVLTTREAFAIKADPARTAAWGVANLAARRRMLADPAIARAALDPAMFGDTPVAIDTVEWFASPRDMGRLLKTLCDADAATRAILAVNPGTEPPIRARFGYVGFKGGSEPGVIAANFLVRTKAGRWLAVTGAWHRLDGSTPTLTFLSLMNRTLVLAAGA